MYSEFLSLVNSGNGKAVGLDQRSDKIFFNLHGHSSEAAAAEAEEATVAAAVAAQAESEADEQPVASTSATGMLFVRTIVITHANNHKYSGDIWQCSKSSHHHFDTSSNAHDEGTHVNTATITRKGNKHMQHTRQGMWSTWFDMHMFSWTWAQRKLLMLCRRSRSDCEGHSSTASWQEVLHKRHHRPWPHPNAYSLWRQFYSPAGQP